MKKDYLIRQNPLRALLLFALPMILGNLFQQFYTMVDSIVVGRFIGENALAAVGASYTLTAVFICIAIGGGIGSSVIIGVYFGAKEFNKMKIAIRTELLAFLSAGIILAIIGLLFGRTIMIWLRTPQEVLHQAIMYLNIYFIGLPFLFMYNILASIFNALGRSVIPLMLLVFSSIFNIILDIILVCSIGLGVQGAAWATLIAQGISAILSFVLLLRELKRYNTDNKDNKTEKSLEHKLGKMLKGKSDYKKDQIVWFDPHELSKMMRVAIPSVIQQSTISIGVMLVQSVVNDFGPQVMAGYSAATRIESICVVPMTVMGSVMSGYTAQNIGAGKLERVKQGYYTGYFIIAVFAIAILIWLEFYNQPLIIQFLGENGSQKALSTGQEYLRYIGFFFALLGMKTITDGVLRGAGDMIWFTIANLVNLSIRVFVAFSFAPSFGITAVFAAVPIGWACNYLISFLQFCTGKWKRKAEAIMEKSLSNA